MVPLLSQDARDSTARTAVLMMLAAVCQSSPPPGRALLAQPHAKLEPVFEADFLPCSHGFRPGRRVHDAVAEVRHLTSRSYEWIVEGDIRACFDEISYVALMERVRARVGDKRVLALVKASLRRASSPRTAR